MTKDGEWANAHEDDPEQDRSSLCQRYSGLKVIFMSGYTQGSVVHEGRLDEGIEFLEKPFTPETLLGKTRVVLDAGMGTPGCVNPSGTRAR